MPGSERNINLRSTPTEIREETCALWDALCEAQVLHNRETGKVNISCVLYKAPDTVETYSIRICCWECSQESTLELAVAMKRLLPDVSFGFKIATAYLLGDHAEVCHTRTEGEPGLLAIVEEAQGEGAAARFYPLTDLGEGRCRMEAPLPCSPNPVFKDTEDEARMQENINAIFNLATAIAGERGG